MENLPQEVFLCILDFVLDHGYPKKKARYATVSWRFQHAVERRIFRKLTLHTSGAESDFSNFIRLFRPAEAHRKALVRELRFNVALPNYGAEDCTRRETEGEQERNSRVFSDSVHGLFRVLKCLDGDGFRDSGGLFLDIFTPSAPMDREFLVRGFMAGRGLREKRYRASVLEIRDPEKLPAVSIVWRLLCGQWTRRRSISPAATMAIVAKLKGLRRARIDCYDLDYFDIATRRMSRLGMSSPDPACRSC